MINQHHDHEEEHPNDAKVDLSTKCALSCNIDIFSANNSFRRQFEEPRQHHGDREPKDERDDDEAHRRIWDIEERKNLRRDLGQQPRAHSI